MNDALAEVAARGQSIWLDDLSRDMLTSGALAAMVEEGVTGVTTNPAIFEHAMASGEAYDGAIRLALRAGATQPRSLYEELVVEDARIAADVLRPAHDRSGGSDGFISLEVAPTLASDADATFEEACRLWARVARPNLLIKVPATPAGLATIPRLIQAGINVNVTLIFSPQMYTEAASAYMAGIQARLDAGLDVSRVAGVASFFVSRIDARVDTLLARRPAHGGAEDPLRGCAALALATLTYDAYRRCFTSPRWQRLHRRGARPQRLLWASTGTKNAADAPTRYVHALVARGTVSTLPLETYRAFRSQALPRSQARPSSARARKLVALLDGAGLSMSEVSRSLLDEGVDRFVRSYQGLQRTLAEKCDPLRKDAAAA